MTAVQRREPISTGSDWSFELIERYDREIGRLAAEFGLDTYPNQIEIIRSDQMLDAYASIGSRLARTARIRSSACCGTGRMWRPGSRCSS